ncbi:hypothetical protein B0J11DRAFT_618411 [Dendryphion nanum]|uniref:Uncharacterized protein n=1 Tax=Dendryphion nanum TaxID=256645 RepID=A0A9P9DBN1_9PLEO|nr:hypothetical protein B0J11DRAFT_618411 [Dendryphion nanum]
MTPLVPDTSDIELDELSTSSSSNTRNTNTTSTPSTSVTSSISTTTPQSSSSVATSRPSSPSSVRSSLTLDAATVSVGPHSPPASFQNGPQTPANPTLGSRLLLLLKKSAKVALSKLKLFDRNIAFGAFIIAGIISYPTFKSWQVGRWTAQKDYLQYCKESLEKLVGKERQYCQFVTDHGLDRPPGLFIRSTQKEKSTIFHSVVFDQLFRRTIVAANASTTLPEQEQPVLKSSSDIPFAVAIVIWTYYVTFYIGVSEAHRRKWPIPVFLHYQRITEFKKRIWVGVSWVFLFAGLMSPILSTISWYVVSHSQAADDVYLSYCKGLRLEGKFDKDCNFFLQKVAQNISYPLYVSSLTISFILSSLFSFCVVLEPILRIMFSREYGRVPSEYVELPSYRVTREFPL